MKGSLYVTVDTSVLVAVIVNEAEKSKLIKITVGMDLVAPASVHWEIGNALAAMLKRNRITGNQIGAILEIYNRIPVRYVEVSLKDALRIAAAFDIYAYDAYIIACAREYRTGLISLDKALCQKARDAGINILEVSL